VEINDSTDIRPGYVNHNSYLSGGYNDTKCRSCHGSLLSGSNANMTEFIHNVAIGQAGNPNCGESGCHNLENGANQKAINFTAVSLGVHGKINQDAINTTDLDGGSVTKACWACHNFGSDGVQPPLDAMSTIEEDYNNPASCYDCHNSTQKAFGNVSSAPAVFEHYVNGSNLRAANSVSGTTLIERISNSCVQCHNQAEMVVENDDPDTGSAVSDVDGDNVLGGNNSFYHYGRNRSNSSDSFNLRVTRNSSLCGDGENTTCTNWNNFTSNMNYTFTNCTYCHQVTEANNNFSGFMNRSDLHSAQQHARPLRQR
jgi:hypothetical protein